MKLSVLLILFLFQESEKFYILELEFVAVYSSPWNSPRILDLVIRVLEKKKLQKMKYWIRKSKRRDEDCKEFLS